MQKSTALRDAQNDQIETTAGPSPILEFRTGAAPTNCAAADTGTLVASLTLPSDFMSASSGGVKSKLGTWEDLLANNSGVIEHYRLKTSGGTCVLQGPVSETGGGGEIIVVNADVNVNQPVIVTAFTITASGA